MKLAGTFSRIGPSKILVIGDLILDTYTIGKVHRISPEAPVGVVHVSREEHRPGGVGNVALNLISLGVDVLLVGRVGNDHAGQLLVKSLKNERVDVKGVVAQSEFQTPVKNRIIAENQQIVRIDHEKISALSLELEQQIIKQLPDLLEGVKAIALSDYGKGVLTPKLIQAVVKEAKKREIPVITDPKGIDFTKYHGTTILKPNLREAYVAANMSSDASLEQVAKQILKDSAAAILMITRGGDGISIFSQDGQREDCYPAMTREVKDVTGAGDTVLAMISCAIANGLSAQEAAELANVAAGIAIEHFGCARVSLSDLAKRLLEINAENKVFDEEHLFALKQALNDETFCVVGIRSNPGLTPTIFQAIQKLRQNRRVLIYLRDKEPDDAFVNLLASLRDVDFIIRKHDSLQNLCSMMHPKEVYIAEANALQQIENIHDLISQ